MGCSCMVIVLVLVLDLTAFALAIAAERRRAGAVIIKDELANTSYCQYESDIASAMGVGAVLFLFLSQLIIMISSRCLCCGRALKPGGARAWAIFLFFACWLTFLTAEVCLLAGSTRNAYHTKYRSQFDTPPSCETLRSGVFAAGAAFIFFTAINSIVYYCVSPEQTSRRLHTAEIPASVWGAYKRISIPL